MQVFIGDCTYSWFTPGMSQDTLRVLQFGEMTVDHITFAKLPLLKDSQSALGDEVGYVQESLL